MLLNGLLGGVLGGLMGGLAFDPIYLSCLRLQRYGEAVSLSRGIGPDH